MDVDSRSSAEVSTIEVDGPLAFTAIACTLICYRGLAE